MAYDLPSFDHSGVLNGDGEKIWEALNALRSVVALLIPLAQRSDQIRVEISGVSPARTISLIVQDGGTTHTVASVTY
jgi:hypothetical protein